MRIIVECDKDIKELWDEVFRCVEDFRKTYLKLKYGELMVTVKMED